jgi:hypothetical protein
LPGSLPAASDGLGAAEKRMTGYPSVDALTDTFRLSSQQDF